MGLIGLFTKKTPQKKLEEIAHQHCLLLLSTGTSLPRTITHDFTHKDGTKWQSTTVITLNKIQEK